jgi:6-phosphogluconolactonase (cycloisomerase 2 family)/uncharacterized protein YmfQ (DUF2313 family)
MKSTARYIFRSLLLLLTIALTLTVPSKAQPISAAQNASARPQFLYVGNRESQDLSAYHINAATGELTPLAGSPFPLAVAPLSLAVSPDGRFLFVAGDHRSAIFAYAIDAHGALVEVAGSPFETSSDPSQLTTDHGGRYLFATSESTGSVLAFAIDSASGQLKPLADSPLSVGRIVSSIAVTADDRFVFVGSPLDRTISVLGLDPHSGALSSESAAPVTLSLSPESLQLSPAGSELRAYDSSAGTVAAFSVDPANGELIAEPGSSSLASAGLAPAGARHITAEDISGRYIFAANPDANTVTRFRIDAQTHQPDPASALTYATGSSPQSVAIANSGAQVSGTLSVSLASSSLLTFATTSGTVTLPAAAVQGSDSTCAGQVIQLAFSVPSIGVISTPSANPATSVCVLIGKTTATFTVTTAANSGSATLTAFATGYDDGTTDLSVSPRAITLSLPFTNIGQGKVVPGTVTLANPAPTGGVTISLASSANATATIAPASLFIAGGSASGSISVTGVQANTATMTASVPSGGYSSSTLGVTVFPPGKTISLPLNAVVGPGQTLPYPVSIGAAATAPVTISLTASGGPGTATFTPASVTIPTGATAPATAPTITGGHIGPLTVTGSATGFASDTENATVQITLTFNPNTLSVETGKIGNLTLSASATAPTGGFTIALTSSSPATATVPASIVMPAGSSTVSVPVTGVAAGTTTIQASAPGAIAASATVTAYAPPGITVYGPNASSAFSVGFNGIVSMYGALAQAAPAGNLAVTFTTPAGSAVLLSNTIGAIGSHSITVTAAAGSTSIPTFYAQATGASGSVVITASAPGYSNGSATATQVPSGFILTGGTTTTTLSSASPVYATFAQLDPSTRAYTASLTLRPGLSAITVPLTNTDTPSGVGTLGSASITFKSGDSQNQTTFQPAAAGSAVISITGGLVSGYFTPSNYKTTTYTVTAPNSSILYCNEEYITGTGSGTIGYNSTCASSVYLATAPPTGGRTVTLTSSNASALLLSTSATAVGAKTITVNVAAGGTSAPFYIQALAASGSATITETVPSYNPTTATVNFVPSGFILTGGTTTTTFSGTSPVYVTFAQLDPSTRAYNGTLTLRPGLAAFNVPLTLTNTPTGVGTLGSSSITFNSGDSQHETTFQPVAAGSAVVSITGGVVAGYYTPSNYKTTTYTVTAPNSSILYCNVEYITGTGTGTMGYNSTCASGVYLASPAPTGGRTVTLTSSDPTKLLLSTAPTTVGVKSITVNVPAGASSGPSFYIQALAGSASATITETVLGYNPTTATVDFVPSGFIVSGGTTTTTFSGTSPVYVTFAQLDPTTRAYVGTLTLRPGLAALSVPLTITNTPSGVGNLGSSSITFNSGDSQNQTTFQPAAAGTSVVGITGGVVAGYYTPSNYKTATYTVSAPNSSILFCDYEYITGTGAGTMGYNSTCTSGVYLATPAPTGGRTVTLTSSDTTKLLLSTSATVVGGKSVTLNVAAGGSSATFYIQALAATGSATITQTVSGYNPTTATVDFAPSGFIVSGGTTTTTFSGTSPVYVIFAQLDPTTRAYTGTLTLRPGLANFNVPLTIANTPSGVGSLASSSITFHSLDTQNQTTFQPAVAGTSVVSITGGVVTGYYAPSNYQTTTYTVSAPNTSVLFCNEEYITGTGAGTLGYNSTCTSGVLLATPAPTGGRTVTLTSSDATKLLLSTTANAVGAKTINVSIGAGGSSATFYIQALAATGSATITQTVPGYNATVATVDFAPSGFILTGGTTTTTFSGASPVYVTFAQLDPATRAYTGSLTLRPGLTAFNVPLTVANTPSGVGTLGSNAIAFNSGDSQHQTTFNPAVAGTSVISVTGGVVPGYYSPSNYQTTTYTVTAPAITVEPVIVGNYMQTSTYGYLQVAVPSTRTVTVSAPSGILLSNSLAAKGTASLSFSLTTGESSIPTFYVQSEGGGAGTVNLTLSAPGYATSTAAVTVYPSGFALQGSNFTTHVTDNPTTLTIVPAALDPTYLNIYQVQELVPNVDQLLSALSPASTPTGTLHLTVQSGTGVGTFSLPSVTFQGDDNPNYLTSSFQPKSAGTALITITSPKGFSNASTQITATVVSP